MFRVHITLNYQNVVHISYTAVTLNECYLQTSTKYCSTPSTKTLLQLYRNIFVFLIRNFFLFFSFLFLYLFIFFLLTVWRNCSLSICELNEYVMLCYDMLLLASPTQTGPMFTLCQVSSYAGPRFCDVSRGLLQRHSCWGIQVHHCDDPAFRPSCVLYYYLYLLTCQSHHMTMTTVSQPGQNQCILLGQ